MNVFFIPLLSAYHTSGSKMRRKELSIIMRSKRFIGRLISAVLAVMLTLVCCPATVFSLDEDDVDTVYDENFKEDPVIEPEVSEPEEDLTDDDSEDEYEDEAEASGENKDHAAGSFNEALLEHKVTTPAKQIKLKTGSSRTLKLGDSFQIKYGFKPSKSDDYIVSYRSYNKTIAQVTQDGVVTAVGIGKAKIQLKAKGGAKVNIYVTVKSDSDIAFDQDVASIDLVDENVMLRKGKTAKIEYILYPIGSYDTVSYSSADTSIAKVSSTGVITGVRAGSTVIELKTNDGITAQCYVTIYDGIYKGIDVSKWQDTIKWNKVKNAGIDFAMIRSSFGDCDKDKMLEKNVAGCEKYGIPYGFYHYTYAKTPAQAKKEARFFLKTIQKYSPEYPVVLDIEEDFYKTMSRKKVTDIICAFAEELEKAGYYTMIYSYSSFFNDFVDMKRIKKYDVWIACWGDEEKLNNSYDGHYGMWQYSSTGRISGISGDVDLNYAYKDYPDRIRKNGLNNL